MTKSESRSSASDFSVPTEWQGHRADRWVGPAELFRVLKSTVGDRGMLVNGEGVESALESRASDSDCAEALKEVRVRVKDIEYSISYRSTSDHSFGQGGTAKHMTVLSKNGSAALCSIRLVSYTTYSDDSEDHEASRRDDTYLLATGDLEINIFEGLSSRAPA